MHGNFVREIWNISAFRIKHIISAVNKWTEFFNVLCLINISIYGNNGKAFPSTFIFYRADKIQTLEDFCLASSFCACFFASSLNKDTPLRFSLSKDNPPVEEFDPKIFKQDRN